MDKRVLLLSSLKQYTGNLTTMKKIKEYLEQASYQVQLEEIKVIHRQLENPNMINPPTKVAMGSMITK
jgi:hypothetical protein